MAIDFAVYEIGKDAIHWTSVQDLKVSDLVQFCYEDRPVEFHYEIDLAATKRLGSVVRSRDASPIILSQL